MTIRDLTNPAFVDALAIALQQKPRHVTDMEAAEIICIAPQMLWFTQVQHWATNPPPGAPVEWQKACEFLVTLISRGYDAEHRTWWYTTREEVNWYREGIFYVMLFGFLVKQVRQHSLMTISAALDVVIDILCGPGWERKLQKLLKDVNARAEAAPKGSNDGGEF